MDDPDRLARRFEQSRGKLRRLAYRMLGSVSEADDAVQEAWLRLARSESDSVDNLGGWLTTVVARICLDMLRSRRSRGEEPLEDRLPEPGEAQRGPEGEALLAEALGPALLLVLDTLTPSERVAFVMHDLFDLPFDEIGAILGRSELAARQLASRARRRVRGGDAAWRADAARQREVVDAFLAASRGGDFDALLAVLAPDVVVRADDLAVQTASGNQRGAPSLASEIRGADAVARAFKGRARGATRAVIDGSAGAVWVAGGRLRAAFLFAVERGHIVEIDIVMDPSDLAELDVELVRD